MNKKRRRARRRRQRAVTVLVIICIALAVAIGYLIVNLMSGNPDGSSLRDDSLVSHVSEESYSESGEPSQSESVSESEEIQPTPEITEEPLPQIDPISPEAINSIYGYMVRPADGLVILDKSASERMYPASMTKVMTILVAIENLPDLDEKLQVTTEVIASLLEQHSSMAGFAEGEWVSVRDLLYGALLPSGGEACITLANRVAGSEAAFAELMNQKAAELGLTGTHFTNTTGLHDDNHYSTCVDMAKLFETAIQNELFYEVITTQTYKCAPNEYHPEGLELHSTMFSSLANLTTNATMENGAVIKGGKTGTTDEGGNCLVSFAEYKGEIYILVTGLGQFNAEGRMYNIEDAVTAYSSL